MRFWVQDVVLGQVQNEEVQNADQGMLMQGDLSRYLRTLLKPQNIVWKPKLGSQTTKCTQTIPTTPMVQSRIKRDQLVVSECSWEAGLKLRQF